MRYKVTFRYVWLTLVIAAGNVRSYLNMLWWYSYIDGLVQERRNSEASQNPIRPNWCTRVADLGSSLSIFKKAVDTKFSY